MATIDAISIKGLRELQAALKNLDGESQKRLRVVFNEAAETVVQGARRRMPTRTGKAKASVRATSGQREAKVSAGSKKTPYTPWLDYGGKTGRNRSVSRPFVSGGRYVYPTYNANKTSIQAALQKQIIELVESVGLEVS